MSGPEPATDAALRQLADYGTRHWQTDAVAEFDNQYRTGSFVTAALSGISIDRQRALWTQMLGEFTMRQRNALQALLAQDSGAVADQAYAVLEAVNPRPTEQAATQPPTANELYAQAVAATTAGQQATTATAAAGDRIRAFAQNAATLETLRTNLAAEFAPLQTGLTSTVQDIGQTASGVQNAESIATIYAHNITEIPIPLINSIPCRTR